MKAAVAPGGREVAQEAVAQVGEAVPEVAPGAAQAEEQVAPGAAQEAVRVEVPGAAGEAMVGSVGSVEPVGVVQVMVPEAGQGVAKPSAARVVQGVRVVQEVAVAPASRLWAA